MSSSATHPTPRRSRGIWVILGRASGAALALVASALLTRLLTKAEFGQFVFATNLIVFGSVLVRFGLERSIVRFLAESLAEGRPERARQYFRLGVRTLATSAIVWALVLPIFYLIAKSLNPDFDMTWKLATLVVIGIVVMSVLQYVAESFRGLNDQASATLFDSQASGPTVNAIFVVAIVAIGLSLGLSAALAIAIQITVMLALALYGAVRLVGVFRSMNGAEIGSANAPAISVSGFLATCFPIMLAQAIVFCTMQGDIWISQFVLGEQNTALLGVARRLVMTISLPLTMMNLIVLPLIPEYYVKGRVAELQTILQRNATAAAIPSLVAMLFLTLLPRWTLSTLFGPEYAEAATALVALAVCQTICILAGTCGQLLMLTGRERIVLVIEFIAAALLFTLGPIAARAYGLNGLAMTSATIFAGKQLVNWALARRLTGIWTHASLAQFTSVAKFLRSQTKHQAKHAANETAQQQA